MNRLLIERLARSPLGQASRSFISPLSYLPSETFTLSSKHFRHSLCLSTSCTLTHVARTRVRFVFSLHSTRAVSATQKTRLKIIRREYFGDATGNHTDYPDHRKALRTGHESLKKLSEILLGSFITFKNGVVKKIFREYYISN